MPKPISKPVTFDPETVEAIRSYQIRKYWEETDQFYQEVFESVFGQPCTCLPSQFSKLQNKHLLSLFFKEPLP